ncbi:MAG: polyamine aminopropyltransferase [Candidatus Omnitrophota bacterium]
MWFQEELYSDLKVRFKGDLMYKDKSPFQDLRIYETKRYGRMLLLDGIVQTTQKDEFIYHEMLTHPFALSHPNPKKALVIGAGDGGVLRELLKHKEIKKITLVEIDKAVIDFSKKYFYSICRKSFQDKRVEIIIDDGAKHVAQTNEKYDIVIVDSTDPMGVAKVLFSPQFYRNIFNVLNKDGVLVRQTGSSFLQPHEIRDNYKILKKIFPEVLPMLAAIPTYVGGFFTFLVALKGKSPLDISYKKLNSEYKKLKLKIKYYNPEIHFAAFAVPNYIQEKLV